MRILFLPLFTLMLLVFSPAIAEDGQRDITVQGEGRVTAAPDMAEITAGVTTQALTASDAIENNSAAVRRVFSALSGFDIGERDRRTSGFNVSPVYARPAPGDSSRRITGYQVSNTVTVTVRNLKNLGGLLDGLVSAGANQISGVRFGIAAPEALKDKAREAAVADARRRAALYAKALGRNLGEALSLTEQGVPSPSPRLFAAAEARSAVPIAPGRQDIVSSVTVVWELE